MALPYKKFSQLFNNASALNQPKKRVQVLSTVLSDSVEPKTLTLCDESGFIVEYPYSLIKANKTEIDKDGFIQLSVEAYRAWFSKIATDETNRLSKLIEENFDMVVSNSQLILADADFSSIHVNILKSGMAYAGGVKYTLGALLNCWISDTRLEIAPGVYMVNINGSPLSGSNKYTVWSVAEKKFTNGSVVMQKKGWRTYFDVFRELANKPNESKMTNVLATTKLLMELGVEC
jgi:hypothetical protein